MKIACEGPPSVSSIALEQWSLLRPCDCTMRLTFLSDYLRWKNDRRGPDFFLIWKEQNLWSLNLCGTIGFAWIDYLGHHLLAYQGYDRGLVDLW